MSRHNCVKIWVGDNHLLMKEVIRALEADGCTENTSSNDKASGNLYAVFVNSCEEWSFVWAVDGRMAFKDSSYKEILPHQIPGFAGISSYALTKEQLCCKRIVLGNNEELSQRVQRALFALGIFWIRSPTLGILDNIYHLFISEDCKMLQTNTKELGRYKEAEYPVIQPDQIPGFLPKLLSSSTNTIQHDTKGKILSDAGATISGGLRAKIGAGKIAGSQRLVGKPLSAKPCQGKIRSGILVSAILIADSY